MKNRNENGLGYEVATHRQGRATKRLIRAVKEQESIRSGIETIDSRTYPILPQVSDELSKAQVFAQYATSTAIADHNHNLSHRYDKRPFPVIRVSYASEAALGDTIDADTKKAEMLANLSSATAMWGGDLVVVDINDTASSNRSTDRDADKLTGVLENPQTAMAVVLYPEEMPIRLSERAGRIEKILAESTTPVLGLVLPTMQPEMGTSMQAELDTATQSLPQHQQ